MQNHYPRWKNWLLIGLLLIAAVYAAPNLFRDDPSVQILAVGEGMTADKDGSLTRIKQILADAQLNYLKIEDQERGWLIRFADPDLQIKARDQLQLALGDRYAAALNLAPRTPQWLQMLGANPMKLGLDLRGGVHFLLAVDLDDMIKKREDGDFRTIISELREAGVRYLSIERLPPHGMIITFQDSANFTKANQRLSSHLKDYQMVKVAAARDAIGLKLTMSDRAVNQIVDYALDQTVNILRNRVNELGVSEAIVQRQGERHVSVDLPGIQDTVRAKEIIGKTATLRFQLVDVERDLESVLAGDIPLGSKLYDYEGRKILLKEQVVLQGNSITYAAPSLSQNGRPAVNIRLGGGGESRFHRITAENVGNALAIVYVETKPDKRVVDGKLVITNRTIERVISAATIQSALGGSFEISGLSSAQYAQDLALLLRSGSLVAPVTIVQETTVGPSMGKANINKGVLSIAVGYIWVMLFMALYYRTFGIISNVALLCNLVFMTAILSILGATLTLPGMAGMVLTVGMAVDASVLIYERIREELRNGVSVQASIARGYQQAFATIIDANVATLIVAMVLFALGSGAVKGFAITLTIGLMTSMLTSIVFTRAIINWGYGRRNTKRLPIGI